MRSFPKRSRHVILYGSGDEKIDFYFERDGRKFFYPRPFEGVIENLNRRYRETDSEAIREEIARFMNVRSCPVCEGARLRKESLHIRIDGKNIHEIYHHVRPGAASRFRQH